MGAVTFNSEIILSQRGAKYNRSEWRSGKALVFETRVVGSRLVSALLFSYVDVGDAFRF